MIIKNIKQRKSWDAFLEEEMCVWSYLYTTKTRKNIKSKDLRLLNYTCRWDERDRFLKMLVNKILEEKCPLVGLVMDTVPGDRYIDYKI